MIDMHESGVVNDVLKRIELLAREHSAERVTAVKLSFSRFSISPEHFREHFDIVSKGTVAEGARLDIEVGEGGQPEVLLDSIEVEGQETA